MSIRFLGLAVLLGAPVVECAVAADICNARSEERVVPLVELYTSEGCSSCPPADRWLSQRVRRHDATANWLAFHVDYWDDLGWPDRFASARYTERQRRRVGAQGDTTVYTPQVMLGENVRMPWHDDALFTRALAQARTPASVGLALSLQHEAHGFALRLGAARVDGRAPTSMSVWLAESVDGQTTDVDAGENNGVRLRHDRVVRKLWGPWPLGGTVLAQRIEIPATSASSDFTAFVQDATGRTLQSLRLPGGCRE